MSIENQIQTVKRLQGALQRAERTLIALETRADVSVGESLSALRREMQQTKQRIARGRQQLSGAERRLAELQGEKTANVINLVDSDDDEERPVNDVGPSQMNEPPARAFRGVLNLSEDEEPVPVRPRGSVKGVRVLVVEASSLERAVAQFETMLARGDAVALQLGQDQPSLLRPALLDSLWAESGKAAIVFALGRAVRSAQSPPSGGSEPDKLVISSASVLDALRNANYDAHIALQHELVSPLLFDVRQTVEHGDEYAFSDTFGFTRGLVFDPNGDEVDRLLDRRDYQWRFAFSPHRHDIALSLQSVRAVKGLADLGIEQSVVRLYVGRNALRGDRGRTILEELQTLLSSESLLVPAIVEQCDPQQTRQRVTAPRSRVPFNAAEIRASVYASGIADAGSVSVPQYTALEASGDYALSLRATEEAKEMGRRVFNGPDGGESANESLLPNELRVGPEAQLALGVDEASAEDDLRRERERERLAALVELEQMLAEGGEETDCSIRRAQSISRSRHGPYVVIDRLREYDLVRPFESLGEDGVPITQQQLEARLQRHSVAPISARFEPPFFYTEQQDLAEQQALEDEEQEERFTKARRKRGADNLGGEPQTQAVLQEIEDAYGVREQSRKKRRMNRASQSEVVLLSGARVLNRWLVLSQAKDKTTATDDLSDDGELSADESVDGDDVIELEDDDEVFDEQLAAGADINNDSPALFAARRLSGYRGPILGVPSNATQSNLLRLISKSEGDWRARAREILFAALYFKLVPRLYTPEFPAEAVTWLRSVLQLICQRLVNEQELYESNQRSVYTRLNRELRKRRIRALEDIEDTPAYDEVLRVAGFTTATLPPLVVVDLNGTIGASVLGADSDFSALDRATVAVIYATHNSEPTNAADLTDVGELRLPASLSLLADRSYPSLDTYLSDQDTLQQLLDVLGEARTRELTAAYLEGDERRFFTEPALAELFFADLGERDTRETRKLIDRFARLVYAQLVPGERNDVKLCFVPPPPAKENDPLAISQSALDSAVANYKVLHDADGVLDTSAIRKLAVARVRDVRDRAARLLVNGCSAPAYTAATQAYASEHFPAYMQDALEWRVNERLPAAPFGQTIKGVVQVDRTLAELLSSNWLGRGRVQLDTRSTRVTDIGVAARFRPFYVLLAPARFIDWCADTSAELARSAATSDLAELLSRIGQTLATTVRDPNVMSYARAQNYIVELARLDAVFARANVGNRSLGRLDANAATVSGLLRRAASDMRERRLTQIDTSLFAITDTSPTPTTVPFAGLGCKEESAPTELMISDENRRALAEVYYRAAQQLGWFASGYLSRPFALTSSLELDVEPTSFADFAHLYTALGLRPSPSARELQFALGREIDLVHAGRTLWFEEALVHADPARFGAAVHSALRYLFLAIRDKQRILAIDYSSAVPSLQLVNRTRVIVDNQSESLQTNVQPLDERASRLLVRASTFANGAAAPPTNLPRNPTLVDIEAPLGNHKAWTARCLLLIEQLERFTNAQEFPRKKARYYESDSARKRDLVELHATTVSLLASDNAFGALEEALASGTLPDPNNLALRKVSVEWLSDFEAARRSLAEEIRAQSVRGTDENPRLAESLDELRTAFQNSVDKLGALLRADGQFGSLGTTFMTDPLFDVTSIERADEPQSYEDAPLSAAQQQRSLVLDDIEERVQDAFDQAQQPIDDMIRQLSESIRLGVMLPLSVQSDEPELSEALEEIYAAALARVQPRSVPITEREFVRQTALLDINTELAKNPIFGLAIAQRFGPIRTALDETRYALGELERGVFEDDEVSAVDDTETGESLRDVVTELERLYSYELDRLALIELVQNIGRDRNVVLSTDRGESLSIPQVVASLLMPAAIERAKLELLSEHKNVIVGAPYALAYSGDIPQGLRVAELVQRYCFFGQVPLPSPTDDPASGLFADAEQLVANALAKTPSDLSERLARSPLLDGVDSVALDLYRAKLIEQRYTPGNGLHHQLPFGADIVLSCQWVRVMRLYLQYHRVEQLITEPESGVASAFESLRLLYQTSTSVGYQQALTREIAALPLAADRVQLYLALIFGRAIDNLLEVLPARSAAQLDLGQWRKRQALTMLPSIEEMRPVDVRLLVSLISGFDYSPLVRRERRDQFNCELRDPDSEQPLDADSDDDELDRSVEDDGQINDTDLRDATQRIDPGFVQRRALAAKEVLVDAYYRCVLERMFEPTPAEIESLRRAANQRTLSADDVEVYYLVRTRASATDKPVAVSELFRQFVAANTFDNPLDPNAVPMLRGIRVRPTQADDAPERQDFISRAKLLGIYDALRRARFTVTPPKRDTLPPSRRYRFAPRGSVHLLSPGAAIYELARGQGRNATQRALLSAALRNYALAYQRDRELDTRLTEAQRDKARQNYDKLAQNQVIRTHYEPAFHVLPRSAIIGAIQRLAVGSEACQNILVAAITVLSKKIDNAQHLWHNDVVRRTFEQQSRLAAQLAQPQSVDGSTTKDEFRDVEVSDVESILERATEALVPHMDLLADQRANGQGLLAVESSSQTNVEQWQAMVERDITNLLGSAAPLALLYPVKPPEGQDLLAYESQQLQMVSESDANEPELVQFIQRSVQPMLPVLRALFEERLDAGGKSRQFSEALVARQRESIEEALRAARPNASAKEYNLFWLLVRTEAARRQRWRPLAQLNDLSAADGVQSLTDDGEAPDARPANEPAGLYAPWSALFYAAVNEVLAKKGNARTLLVEYVKREADNDDAWAVLARTRIADKTAKVGRGEVERYLPVYALLDQLLFSTRGTKTSVRRNAQLHPLMPLLLAPVAGRFIVRVSSRADLSSKQKLTLTQLAGPIYPDSGLFDADEVRQRTQLVVASDSSTLLYHEVDPRTDRGSLPYTVVSPVVVAATKKSDVFPLDTSVDSVLRRLASTEKGPGAQRLPLLIFKK